MTYREREQETIRRLREQLDERQNDEARRVIGELASDPQVEPDDKAEVLFELICL